MLDLTRFPSSFSHLHCLNHLARESLPCIALNHVAYAVDAAEAYQLDVLNIAAYRCGSAEDTNAGHGSRVVTSVVDRELEWLDAPLIVVGAVVGIEHHLDDESNVFDDAVAWFECILGLADPILVALHGAESLLPLLLIAGLLLILATRVWAGRWTWRYWTGIVSLEAAPCRWSVDARRTIG